MPDEATPSNAEHRWLLTGYLPCLGCRYNLRGLVGPLIRCPECGHAYDLRTPQLWQMTKMPLGEQVRQHWPAVAVLWSLFIPFSTLCCGVAFFDRHTAFMSVGAILPGVFWLYKCVRWVRSCHHTGWAILVLLVLHVSTYGLLGGFLWFMTATVLGDGNLTQKMLHWVASVGVMSLGLGYKWVMRELRGRERPGKYRNDWRNYRLPVEMDQPILLTDDMS